MILEEAVEVLRIEAEGVLALADRLGDSFVGAVEAVFHAKGRVIVAGIGKSGLVGRKIVATLNSTGTPSLFLHPVEAMHGDLGMVGGDDVFLAISNSGETDELNALIPSIRRVGCPVVAFTGNPASTLARAADWAIDTGVAREACPLGLAPTASTTAQMAMGDALAVVLINKHHFNSEDFARFHPGGALGQRLAFRVREIMAAGDQVPLVDADTPALAAIAEMDRLEMGVTLVAGPKNRLAGIITDGDLRRLLLSGRMPDNLAATDLMTPDPKSVGPESQVSVALNLMERHLITALPVVDDNHAILGILHLHDILGKGSLRFT